MNKLIASLVALAVTFSASAQLTNAFHETFYTDDATVAGYPVGASTYRIYAGLNDANDILTAVYAAGNDLLFIGSDNDEIWNSGFGAVNGDGINPAFFPGFPASEYDSFVTIGRANSGDAGQPITAVAAIPSGTVLSDAFGVVTPGIDENDTNVTLLDGSWFTFPGDVNSVGTGIDNRILLGQITTTGDVMYQLNVQILDGGLGGTPELYIAYAGGLDAGDIHDASLAYPAAVPTGCTDMLACNYDAAAIVDDGQCDYSCYGCIDPTACNYDASSTIDDLSCDYACYGCTDGGACNYNAASTLDDGSCYFVGDACDDGDAGTNSDIIQADCNCAGIAPLALSPYGSCVSVAGSVGASAAIYTLVPESPGLHLEVITGDFDAQIDLDGPGFSTDFSINDNGGVGNEILNAVNLQKGQTYTITISSNSGMGNFSICAMDLPETRFDYAPGNYDLCEMIKADWVGAENYRFRFQDVIGTAVGEWETGGAYTFAQLRNIMGLAAGQLYFVRCDAAYTVGTFDGGTESVWVLGDVATQITVIAPTNVVVRASDNCANHGPHYLGDYIAAAPYQCGVVDWNWTFTNQAGGLPIAHNRGNGNRYLRLSGVSGLEPGASYDVTVSGVYQNGIETNTSAIQCISIVGAAPTLAGGPVVDNQADLARMDDGASAAIYPNPVSGDVVNVNLSGVTDTKVTMDIFDSFGKLVQSEQLNVAEGSVNKVVSVNGLAAGVYIVNLTINGQVVTERLIVQK